MGGSRLLPCKLTPEPHFASRKSLLSLQRLRNAVRSLKEGHATTRFHQSHCWFSHYMAAHHACAARSSPSHRGAHYFGGRRPARTATGADPATKSARAGMEARHESENRLTLGRHQQRTHPDDGERIGR